MSRGIRKTGVLAMVVMLAATLSGCRLAKKDEDGTVKKTLYGAYAVVGKSLDDPDIPDPEMEGTTVGQKDKKEISLDLFKMTSLYRRNDSYGN